MRYMMVIDMQRCLGCDTCTVSCKQENGTPADVFFARVFNHEVGKFPDVKRVYMPVLCNHCERPQCVEACPNKAIFKRRDGIVLIDQERCKGTGACVSACPYGNIFLRKEDSWYLEEGAATEEIAKNRLEKNVARKCTYCAHRVERGLKPACVVGCPATARIFGDIDDPGSEVSVFLNEQKEKTGRKRFVLLEGIGCKPSTGYLEPMAKQITAMLVTLILCVASFHAQATQLGEKYTEHCAACHGDGGEGGFGPALSGTALNFEQFRGIVRSGKGMMPAIKEVSDEDLKGMFGLFVKNVGGDASGGTLFSAGSLTSGKNVGKIAWGSIFVMLLGSVYVTFSKYLKWGAFFHARRYYFKLGIAKIIAIIFKVAFGDTLSVSSVFKKNPKRWLVHGLLAYGFIGLIIADILIAIFNPERVAMPLLSPLKILVNTCGVAALIGLSIVIFRLFTDPFEDNGVTFKGDIIFILLLFLVIATGFVVEATRYMRLPQYTVYIYSAHIIFMSLLFVTAPFTRFVHILATFLLVLNTRMAEAVVEAKSTFMNEPAPGRHFKSGRIANDFFKRNDVKIRYYP